jgi:hypothetical protein
MSNRITTNEEKITIKASWQITTGDRLLIAGATYRQALTYLNDLKQWNKTLQYPITDLRKKPYALR